MYMCLTSTVRDFKTVWVANFSVMKKYFSRKCLQKQMAVEDSQSVLISVTIVQLWVV